MTKFTHHFLRLLHVLLFSFVLQVSAYMDCPTAAPIIDLRPHQQDFLLFGASEFDNTGQAVALCDLNGDGRSDLVIGAPDYSYTGRNGCGIVYVLLSSDTMGASIDLGSVRPDLIRIIGPSSNAFLGSVLSKGNINGDASEDLLCGMPNVSANGRIFSGQIAAIFGNASLPDTIDLASVSLGVTFIDGMNMFDKLGTSIAAGDLNNDTFDDIVAGAPFASPPSGFAAGKTFIIFGGAALPLQIDLASPPTPTTQIFGENPNATFGTSCAVADISDDPFADIIVAAPQTSLPGRPSAGVVFFLPGGTSFPDTIDISVSPPGLKRIHGAAAEDLTGFAIATGNVTGSMTEDILISAPDHSLAGRDGSGVVYLIPGGTVLPDTIDLAAAPLYVVDIHGPENGEAIGYCLVSADLNGDGYNEIIIGAPHAAPMGRQGAGKVFILFGRSEFHTFLDLATPQDGLTTVFGAWPGDEAGISLGVGNTESGTYDDLLIGARFAEDPDQITTGVAYLILGDDQITPVQLISYYSKVHPGKVELYWELSPPVETCAYRIERSSGSAHAIVLPKNLIREFFPGSYTLSDPSVSPGERYTYHVYLEETLLFSADVQIPSASARLLPNFPNPFIGETTIPFSLPEAGRVVMRVYDVRGALVSVVTNSVFKGGLNSISWSGLDEDGSRVPSGIYFLRMEFGGKVLQRKVVVLR